MLKIKQAENQVKTSKRPFSAVFFSFVFIANLISPALAYADNSTTYAWSAPQTTCSDSFNRFPYPTSYPGSYVTGTCDASHVGWYYILMPGDPGFPTQGQGRNPYASGCLGGNAGLTYVYEQCGAVTPAPITLSSIAITTLPNKIVYAIGDSFDQTGLVVTGTMSDGSKVIETIVASDITGFDSSKAGTDTLTVTFQGKTATFDVTISSSVTPITLSSIVITTLPNKIVYAIGDSFDQTGLVVTGTMSDGTTQIETIVASDITGFDSSTIGTKTLVVTFGGKTATFNVNVLIVVPTHTLEVLPQGAGTVTSNPAGISCSSASGCSATFDNGTSIILTEAPDTGNVFSGWDGACLGQGTSSTCALMLNSDMIVKANFATTFINPAPSAPVISGPTTGNTNVAYTFTASSTDPGNNLLTYGFDWNNDGAVDFTSSPTASGFAVSEPNTWTSAGNYTFAVVATNPSSAAATSTYSIVITDASSGGGSSSNTSTGGSSSGSGHSSGGGHNVNPATTTTTTTITTVTNTEANTSSIPTVGQSVCKAGDYITAYMKQGIDNNPVEVTKLQNFLNEYEGANISVTGVFDASTTAAVKVFQVKYTKDVLSPWGITNPTGIVYITTTHEINNIFCSLNPDYIGGTGATTTPEFNGAVGFNATTSTSTISLGSNIAGIIGAIDQGLKDFLKDILWYPLLILILMGTGVWLIMRFIFLKDKKDKYKQEFFINGISAFLVASVLDVVNTIFYILAPVSFMSFTKMTTGTILGLDLINIVSILVIALASLYVFQDYIIKREISIA